MESIRRKMWGGRARPVRPSNTRRLARAAAGASTPTVGVAAQTEPTRAVRRVLLRQVCSVQYGTLAYMEDTKFWKVHVGFHGERKGNEGGLLLESTGSEARSTHKTITNH